MSIEHVAAGIAGHTGADGSWAAAVLTAVAAVAAGATLQALRWRRRTRRRQRQQRDRHLKLAMWASGEHFWNYDLQQRTLRRMRVDGAAPHAQGIAMVIREDEPLRIHPDDMAQAERVLREHLED